MISQTDQYNTLIKALLPEEIFEYFEIVKVDIDDKFIDVHLDELNLPPKEYSKEKLSSKGFHEAVPFQDFPISIDGGAANGESANFSCKQRVRITGFLGHLPVDNRSTH